jgi:hypothetical protein
MNFNLMEFGYISNDRSACPKPELWLQDDRRTSTVLVVLDASARLTYHSQSL